MPRISVIVPVYKAEKYLQRCIDSILGQTFSDFECILVDDGSPDHSPNICDEYATKNPQIRVIHQANAGVSAARNTGIDAARGEWLCFVDSDDWVDSLYLETLYAQTERNNVQMVVCGRINEQLDSTLIKNPVVDTRFVFNRSDFFEFYKKNRSRYDSPCFIFVTNELISREFLGNIRFDENRTMGEDQVFNLDLYDKIESIVYVPECLYYYACNPESVCNSFKLNHVDNLIHEIEVHESFCEKYFSKKDRSWFILLKKNSILIGLLSCLYNLSTKSAIFSPFILFSTFTPVLLKVFVTALNDV